MLGNTYLITALSRITKMASLQCLWAGEATASVTPRETCLLFKMISLPFKGEGGKGLNQIRLTAAIYVPALRYASKQNLPGFMAQPERNWRWSPMQHIGLKTQTDLSSQIKAAAMETGSFYFTYPQRRTNS